MVFLGWNSFDESDFFRIRNYVFDGGTLVLTAAHLNAELQPDQPAKFPTNDAVIREMLGDNYKSLKDRYPVRIRKDHLLPAGSLSGRIVFEKPV